MKNTVHDGYSRYLPTDPVQEIWGLSVVDCGYTEIPPNTLYPPNPHPQKYDLDWQHGRILDEFQLVYITAGNGTFESSSGGCHTISAGTAFLLFPGEWHRYRPDIKTGWVEYWIGFKGEYCDNLMKQLFSKNQPVIDVGHDVEMENQLQTISDFLQLSQPGYKEILSGYTIAILSRLRSHILGQSNKNNNTQGKIEKARQYILKHSTKDIDLKNFGVKFGMSYSGFRAAFKSETGLSPRQYHLEIRVNHSKELLAQSDYPIAEIGEMVGFTSGFYFSRIFSKKTNKSPSEYRKEYRKKLQPQQE